MAAQDFINSAKVKVREGDVGAERPNSEAVNSKIGGSINALIDSSFFQFRVNQLGYIGQSSLFIAAPYTVRAQSRIVAYELSLTNTGNSGITSIQVEIINTVGAFVGNLFNISNIPSISGNNGNNGGIINDIAASSQATYNLPGHTITYGSLNFLEIQAGHKLIFKVQSNANLARGLNFNMRLSEI